MSTIPELTKHARELMHKAVENTKREFSGIRSGKASTSLLDLVRGGRIIDLTHAAFKQLSSPHRGLVAVKVERVR